jgi:glycosyltransferase involved in cell wall biosynthesis
LLICTPCHVLHGGVERIIESLARGLPAHGFRVVVGLARGERFHLPERFRQEYPDLDCVEIEGRSGTRLGRQRGVRRTLAEVRPDVVLIARLFDAYEAVVERKHRGDPVRLAVTVQAYEPDYVTDLATFADWVDLCVTSGRLIARAAERFTTLPADRVRSIPGVVRPASTRVTHDDARPLRLGYVGRIEQPQKRIFDLVDTLAALRDAGVPFTCEVAGSGPNEDELRRRVAGSGLDGRVGFRGWCGTEHLYREVYPNLDVVLHFAAFEGITIAPREAMAHGCVPVVSLFTGCLAEGQFVDGDNALAFDVGDTAAAAECVWRLHEDRTLLRRLSAAAARSQADINSEDGAAAAWAGGFRQALATPPRKGDRPPRLPWPAGGRLERWGLPAAWAETVRGWMGRKSLHSSPGGEWPHVSGLADSARLREIADFAALYEGELRAGIRPPAVSQ